MTEKRSKLPKVVYSVEEEDWLVSNALEYREIIENKRTDGAAKRDKDKAWEEIAETFNITPPSQERSVKSLREKYAKIKQNLRNRLISKDDSQTGGDSPESELPGLSEPMQELFKILISSTCGLSAATEESDYTVVDKEAGKLWTAPNSLLKNRRRRQVDTEVDTPKKIPKLLLEKQQHLATKHAIELGILECEREWYKLERERAILDVQRASFERERAEFDRERSLVELQRAKNQLICDNELHDISLAILKEGHAERRHSSPKSSSKNDSI